MFPGPLAGHADGPCASFRLTFTEANARHKATSHKSLGCDWKNAGKMWGILHVNSRGKLAHTFHSVLFFTRAHGGLAHLCCGKHKFVKFTARCYGKVFTESGGRKKFKRQIRISKLETLLPVVRGSPDPASLRAGNRRSPVPRFGRPAVVGLAWSGDHARTRRPRQNKGKSSRDNSGYPVPGCHRICQSSCRA